MSDRPQTSLLRKIASRRSRGRRGHRAAAWTFVSADEGSHEGLDTIFSIASQRALTPREVEVLRFVARGETDRGIAARLYLSRRTVSTHVSNILGKLDVPSRRAAVITALRLGLL